MSRADYLAGWVLLAGPVVASALVAYVVIRRRLAHLDRLESAVAGTLIWLAAFIAIHLVPLVLGVLSQGTVVAAAALAAIAPAAIPRAAASDDESARPAQAAAGPLAWILGGGAAVLVAGAALAAAREWVSRPLIGVDTLTFHLPNAGRWMESGSLWQIDQFIPLQVQGYYPNHGDVLLLGAMLPWDNDFFVRIPILAVFAGLALALWAVARELGASHPTALAIAAAVCSLPILARSTVPRAMPDVIMVFALAASLLFALRFARTGRRPDLILLALGLGLALGTKWYGAPAAAVAVLVLVAARWRGGGTPRAALTDGVVVSAVAFAAGGIWLVRNLVEVGNPLFPLKTPLFDAPRDVVTELVGFSISDYIGDPDVFFGQLPGEIIAGVGWAPAVIAAAMVAALVVARARPPGRVLALAAAATLLALAYVVTPNTALGYKGDPNEANFNTRYMLPAVMCAAAVAAWGAGRVPALARVLEGGLLAATALAVGDAFMPLDAGRLAKGLVGVALLAGAVLGARALAARLSGKVVAAACGGLALLVLVGYGWRMQERINAVRYADGSDAVITAVDRAGEMHGPQDVAIAGDWNSEGTSPVWPSFGDRIQNRVTVIGYDNRGFLTNYASQAPFTAALEREDPDLLIVGRGLRPRPGVQPPEQGWAAGAGFQLIASTDRLVLMAR